jgi:hypothetical protein
MVEAETLVEKPVGGLLAEFLKAYLELGFSFFPVEWGQKAPPLVKWEEFQSRKPSREEVEAWLSKYTLFNVAVVCGRVSNLFVVDFDSEEAFESWLKGLPKELKEYIMAACWFVKTQKGYHVYIRPEDPELIPRTKIRCREGVDIKGEGGYVIAPPSKHPSGASYKGWYSPKPSLAPLKREAVEKLLVSLQPALALEEKQAEPKEEAPKPVPKPPEELRELDDGKLEELYGILRPFYEPGSRHKMLLGLSGLAAKLGVSPVSIAKVVKRLHDETGDEDDIRTRGGCIVYSYARVGVPVDKKALAEVLGAEPHGPSEPQPQPVVGSSALYEVFKAKVGEEEARKLLARVKRLLAPPPLRIPVEWVIREGGREARTWLIVRWRGDRIEVFLRRRAGKGFVERPFAVLPEIVFLRDLATGNVFYLAREEDRVVAISTDLEGLLRQLVAQGYVSKTTLADINLQLLLRAVMRREEGELAPGFGLDGFHDPYGWGFDLADHGVSGLLEVKEWIENYPPSNRRVTLADVALFLAKLLTPAVRRMNPTFVDSLVWNYGLGGEGKTTLVDLVLLPLIGLDPNDDRPLVKITGAVETSAQMAFLVSVNRLPLVLDEQTLPNLEKNAHIILSVSVGYGTFKIHAPRYGALGEVRFKNQRGVIVFTNTEFARWLRRVRHVASDFAFARRVLPLRWENESIDKRAFEDPPRPEPVLGAVERVWLKHREELARSKDVAELAAKLMELLGREYGADLSAYVRAVREAVEEWSRERDSVKVTDVDIARERAYEIARQQLGATSLTGAKVLQSILENPDVYGAKLMKPKDNEACVKEREELKALAARLQPFEGTRQLAEALYHLEAEGATRIVLKANSPLVPGAPRQFLGVEKHQYKFGSDYAHGYALPITRFAEIFLLSAIDEEPQGSQKSGAMGANDDEPSATRSRNGEEV